MAGAAVLSAFVQTLLEKLISSALDEFQSLWTVNKEVTKLAATLSTIQTLLEDAEEKQATNRSVRAWLIKLQDVAYDMDDLLEKHAAKAALDSKLEDQSQSPWRKKVINYVSCYCLNQGMFRYGLANQIKDIQGRLDSITKERDLLGLRILDVSRLEVAERPQTSSLLDDSSILGRDEDKEKIVKILLDVNRASRLNVSVLPIVGMGGLGKTTLTQQVYNDERIKEHFQLRMWVSVSENFDEIKLTKETLESTAIGTLSTATGTSTGISVTTTTNMNLLQDNLCEKLKGKLFLLVLDDVWNEDQNKWHRYRSTLLVGKKGSKIVVTTRNENVGTIMGGLPPYKLKQLSDDDCWNVFKNYAFVDGDSSDHPRLEEIGKEIVKKLKGLPLAAKALGSLLYSKLDESDWKDILRNEIWELPQDKNNILPALRLSYKHLPPHLKQCFAFCSVFHKDYVFEKEKLVQMWMAHGFIQPQGRKRIEDVGSSYFDDLVNRSFFQPYKGKHVMHDAQHDLAQHISAEECIRFEDGLRAGNAMRTRHLSFSCDNSRPTSFDRFYQFTKLRTLLLLRGFKSPTSDIPSSLFEKLKYIRVLDLHRRDIDELPESIGYLKQLRYLGLSNTGLKALPSSLRRLYNLQTLKLKGCNELDELPRGITSLINLRHLEASSQLVSGIASIGRLSSLQKLKEFTVRKDQRYSIRELKDMSELRGHLRICNLENVESKKDAVEGNMEGKEYLNELELIWSEATRVNSLDRLDDEVLEGLQPHHELKKLVIEGFTGFRFPRWLGSKSFSNLETIHISICRNCSFLPPLGQLPFLRYLVIVGVLGVTRISEEFLGSGAIRGFPSLYELVLEGMPNLEEWSTPEEEKLFSCLTDLEIVDCPKLRCLPQLPPTIKRLKISEAGLVALPQHWGLESQSSCLSSLYIYDCPNLISFERGLLSHELDALEQLTIASCRELLTLPHECFRSLISLKSLHIFNCPTLTIETHGGVILPSSIQDIQVRGCSSGFICALLKGLENLTALAELKIAECHDLLYLPEEAHPVALKFLAISDCANLQFLPSWLQRLSSLTTLAIINCFSILFFPQSGLPSMLQELYVKGCPLLKEQFEENGRGEWDMIAHIPDVEIHEDRIIKKREER